MSLPPIVRVFGRLASVWHLIILKLKQWSRRCEFRANLGRLLGVVLNAFRRLSEFRVSDSYVVPIIPPRPLETYGAAALESMVLQWICVDHAWSSCSIRQQPPRQRILDNTWLKTRFALIEGGQWLLTTDEYGSVLAHDLDSPSLKMGTYVLIRPDDRRDHILISDLLTSKFLKSFYTRSSEIVFNTSLLHSLYARTVSPWAVEIFDWQKSTGMVHVKSHIRPEENMVSVRLLPGRRVLTGRKSAIHIYAIPECSCYSATVPFDPLETAEAQTALHVIPIGGDLVMGGISPSYISPAGKIYISLASSQHIFALTADVNNGAPSVSVIKLIDYSMRFEGTAYALGLHRMLIRQDYMPDSIITLNLLWDQQFNVNEHYWDETVYHSSKTTLDEWSGRVVDCLEDGRIMIVDFASERARFADRSIGLHHYW
ncbi:hypothetical protein PLEOSDRAFT_166865 [Pleurotus ostreatus PC15]|uniref:F-box domain-containing protein n=1 Tax=Pleurotus ostreatus (strain PC15) TaxID=1137138 RepID=A0A067NYJ6_PLEO1|nr:hypothetical protein PLEOSDRAFT_166865 [Pleurotus ostreatus PC15]